MGRIQLQLYTVTVKRLTRQHNLAPSTTTQTQATRCSWVPGGTDQYRQFKGRIDDVRIYSRPLSLAEIAVLYREEGFTN